MRPAKETFSSLDSSLDKQETDSISTLSARTASFASSHNPSSPANLLSRSATAGGLETEESSDLTISGITSPSSSPKPSDEELFDADSMSAREEHLEQGEFPEWSRANISGDEGTVANTMKNRSQTSVKSHLMLARLCQRISWEALLEDRVEDQAWEGIRSDIRDRISIYSSEAPIPTRRPESGSESEDGNAKTNLLDGSRFTTSFSSLRAAQEGGLYKSRGSEESESQSESSHDRRVSFASVARCRMFRS